MKKTNFDRMLERYLNGQVSDEERNKIEAWLESKNEERDKDSIWSEEEEEAIFLRLRDKIKSQDRFSTPEPHQNWMRYGIAASILVICVASVLVWIGFFSGSPEEYHFSSGTTSDKVILKDGSIVWLKPNSTISFHQIKTTGWRQAEFLGEALFEIAKDPQHPFLITCGTVTAKVLGTSFSIATGKDKIELKVLTGKVSLSSDVDGPEIVVLPNEKVTYATQGQVERSQMTLDEDDAIINSTDYRMIFRNAAMVDVLEKIEKKFNAKLTIGNQELKQCRITADFTDRSLQDTFLMLSELLEIDYVISDNKVDIRGKGCN